MSEKVVSVLVYFLVLGQVLIFYMLLRENRRAVVPPPTPQSPCYQVTYYRGDQAIFTVLFDRPGIIESEDKMHRMVVETGVEITKRFKEDLG